MRASELLLLWEECKSPLNLEWSKKFLGHPDISEILKFDRKDIYECISEINKLDELLPKLQSKSHHTIKDLPAEKQRASNKRKVMRNPNSSTGAWSNVAESRSIQSRVCPRCKSMAELQTSRTDTWFGLYFCYQCYKPVL